MVEHPPTADILAAVHKVEPKRRKLRWRKPTEEYFEQEFSEVPIFMDQGAEKPSSDFVESMQFAEELMKKMGKA